MKLSILLFLACLWGSVFPDVVDKCPTGIKPCKCKTNYDGACIITCGLVAMKDVERIADLPNLCDGHVHFVLVHTKIPGIPTRLWKTLLTSKTVDVSIQYAGIEHFVPPGDDPIPRSHTPGDAVIKIAHSLVDNWDWWQLKDFTSEDDFTLVIDDTPLTELTSDFAEIAGGRVHKVTIDGTQLTSVPDRLFADFDELTSLSLQNNNLTSVSRSMAPKPAKALQYLHLNGNFLTSLPGDLFAEMPVLEVVYLRDNKLKSLPQDLFESISSSKLYLIEFVNNPWDCDCRLMWILSSTKKRMNLGVCASPDSVAGKKVKDLPNLLKC